MNWQEDACNDPIWETDVQRARRILRKVLGPPKIEFNKEESLAFIEKIKGIEPLRSSNSQRFETDEYLIDGTKYHVCYGVGDYPLVQKFLDGESEEM